MLNTDHMKSLATSALFLALFLLHPTTVVADAIPIDEVDRESPVDFATEVFPILKQNCIACHNEAEPTNELILESPDAIRAGGDSGPAVVPGKPGESLLLTVASHADEPIMPPEENEVGARNLTSAELGLIKRWIAEGAAGTVAKAATVQWQPLPPGVSPIYACAITPGGLVAACSRGNQVFLYDVATGETITRLTDTALIDAGLYDKPGVAHRDLVQSLAFSADGRTLATGGYRTIKVWRRPASALESRLAAAEVSLTAVARSADGSWLATAGDDNQIRLWRLDPDQPNAAHLGPVLTGHEAIVRALAFAPDASKVVSAGDDRTIRVWNVADGTPLQRIDAPSAVHALHVSNDGTTIISGADDGTIHEWLLATSPPTRSKLNLAEITATATNATQTLLALGTAAGQVHLLDLATSATRQLAAPSDQPIRSLQFNSADDQLLAVDTTGELTLLRIADGQPLTRIAPTNPAIRVAAFAPNADPAATSVLTLSADGVIRQSRTTAELRNLPPAVETPPRHIAASPDGTRLLTDGRIAGKPALILRDATTGEVLATFTDLAAEVTALAFSPDATLVAAASTDGNLHTWHVAERRRLATFSAHSAPVSCLAFLPDGSHIVSGAANHTLKLWNPASGEETRQLIGHGGAVIDVTVTPSHIVSVADDRTLRVWNHDGTLHSEKPLSGLPTSLSFTPTRGELAVAIADAGVEIFSADFEPAVTLPAVVTPETTTAFSADGSRLLVVTPNSTLQIFDRDSLLLCESVGLSASITAATWTNGSEGLIVGTKDNALQVVPLRYQRTIARDAAPDAQLATLDADSLLVVSPTAGTATIHTLSTGEVRHRVDLAAPVSAFTLRPDRSQAILATPTHLKTVDVASGQIASDLPHNLGNVNITSLASSTDATRLLIGTTSGTSHLLDVASGRVLQSFRQNESPIATVSVVSPASDAEPTALAILTMTGEFVRTSPSASRQFLGHAAAVTGLALIPTDPPQLLSGSRDGTARRWDLATGTETAQLNHEAAIDSIAASSDGTRLATAGGTAAKLWNAADNALLATLSGSQQANDEQSHRNILNDVAAQRVARRQSELDTANKELEAAANAVATAVTARDEAKPKVPAADEALAAANTAKAAADEKFTTSEAAAKQAETVLTSATEAAAAATAAAELAQSRAAAVEPVVANAQQAAATLATALAAAESAAQANPEDSLISQLVDSARTASAGAQAAEAKATETRAALIQAAEAATAALTAAQQQQSAAQEAKTAADAALATAKTEQEAAAKAATDADAAQKAAVKALADAEKGVKDAEANRAVSESKVARTTDELNAAQTLAQEATDTLAAATQRAASAALPVRTVAFAPDGKRLAMAGDDQRIRTYDAASGTPDEEFPAHDAPLLDLCYLDAHRLLSASADRTVASWNLRPEWALASTLGITAEEAPADAAPVDRVLALRFNPDGKLLATGGGEPSRNGELLIWNVESGELLHNFTDAHSDTVFGVDFSADGRFLASCGADKFVRVFDVASRELVRSFEGHTNHVLGVAWRVDGATLASCGADNVIKVWNFETGEQRRTISGFAKQVTAVDFAGTTQFAVASSGDKYVRSYNTDDGKKASDYGGASDFLYCTALTSDGRLVAAAGQDGVFRIWNREDAKLAVAFDPPSQDPAQSE